MKLFKKDKSGKQKYQGTWVISEGVQSKHNNRPKNNRQRHGGAGPSHMGGAQSKQVGCVKWDRGVRNKMMWGCVQ